MIEFGSDFHRCDLPFHGQTTIHTLFRSPLFYASGRMALKALVAQEGWKRLWIPAYFCHEILDFWKQSTDICLYDDYPLEENDDQIVRSLPYKIGDALLRMNFFGLRDLRSNDNMPVPVIEDHSHALTSSWALNSDADYCIASLRKSLPLALGGIAWSPKGLHMPNVPMHDTQCDQLAQERYEAMQMKAQYLQRGGDKETFRTIYLATEDGLGNATGIAAIDSQSEQILQHLDICRWNEQKRQNWCIACEQLKRFKIVGRDKNPQAPFSLILLAKTPDERNLLKAYLLRNAIFPATLWTIPNEVEQTRCKAFGDRMLSLHCDARYTGQDMLYMCETINRYDTNN